jgi:2,4-didehydro-3-deoxy-L-rhamnonate hydrolase
MKLVRFGDPNKEKPGVYRDGNIYDVSGFIRDYDETFFEHGGLQHLKWMVDQNKTILRRVTPGTRLGSPVPRPSKIICIGLNYADHAAESKMELPKEPVFFLKSTTALCGPNDNLVIPKNSHKTDWEVELAIVIGKRATYIEEKDALSHIAGFMIHNDYSEREFQLERGGQWVKGKSCDTFAPFGPWLSTTDEIDDQNNLRLWLKVNGKTMQDGSTRNLVFKIPFLVSYVSQFMTLLPGDVISTGTPAGVGLGQKPLPVYIKPGDKIELGIDGLGVQQQTAKSWG